jgi:hypothetical protein
VVVILVALTLGDAVGAVLADETFGYLAILSLIGIAGGLVGGTMTGIALSRLLLRPIFVVR